MKRNTSAGELSKAVMKELWNRAPSVAPDRRLDTGFRILRNVACSFPEMR
jgi:hypothetical protein